MRVFQAWSNVFAHETVALGCAATGGSWPLWKAFHNVQVRPFIERQRQESDRQVRDEKQTIIDGSLSRSTRNP